MSPDHGILWNAGEKPVNLNAVPPIVTAGLVTPTLILTAVLWSYIDRTGRAAHRIGRLWARSILLASRVGVEVKGAENLEPDRTYVFAANHSSAFDILVLMGRLPFEFKWLAKEELFRIPVFGRGMKVAGNIPIDRSNPRAWVRSLNQVAEKIRAGTSVVIFPEGTRSKDGSILEFKRGGFTIAARSGVPVVPVSISGAHRVLPSKTLDLNPGPIRLVLGRPIPTAGLDRAGQDEVMELVRREIIDNHDPDYGRP